MPNEPIDTASYGPAEPADDLLPYQRWLNGDLAFADLDADDQVRAARFLAQS